MGRAGRRCTLEDGERHALRAVASRPEKAAEARLLLARSLVAQSRGREIEVPKMVVEALSMTEADSLTIENAVALVEAAGVAFEKGAGATTGFQSVELFARAVSEAAPPGEVRGRGGHRRCRRGEDGNREGEGAEGGSGGEGVLFFEAVEQKNVKRKDEKKRTSLCLISCQ